jgi:nucleoside-diphosphate-sugar epimerase
VAVIFVTGGSGFIGSAFVLAAVGAGHDVFALARSAASEERVRRLGGIPISGDLEDGADSWHAAARKADAVVHLAQPQAFGGRVTISRAKRYLESRLVMDRNLFEAVGTSGVKRILYLGGTSYYGDCGTALHGEDTTPHPQGWGPYIAPAIEALPGFVARGLPIVEAFPGWVYGPSSWFAEYFLQPLARGKRVTAIAGSSRYVSPIHVDDCAAALIHLLGRGEPGRRYFVVDDKPVPSSRLAEIAADALGVSLRWRHLPEFVCRMLLGPVVTDSLTYENRLSNARLRSSGFVLRYPTSEDGVRAAVAAFRH